METTYKNLIDKAYEAMRYAYTPYSKFKVGAALLTDTDEVYTGCNIESASYGATNCAERTALFKAVSEGHRAFKAIAVVGEAKVPTYPCGICRQMLMEFGDMDVLLDQNGTLVIHRLSELLPHSFTASDLFQL
ncbi:cytidine deaminase [Acidaminobacter hydrogenoformans]|uniref:Cytidine deaminase n=1 Tax=Acidaminobacter hydrogenoformans DSM 2784 TaxID=1120920 RepID=A0A1G5RST5_9FIRM|nr:cytidine deaminase [Acidaminobacter hydrogenoformans]SCZ77154.1 cytidine deaminase [Acidaminobacter hydrogenoformans DSM 2784]